MQENQVFLLKRTFLLMCSALVMASSIFFLRQTSIIQANTLTVTNVNDGGAGSLRNAISNAMPGDSIVFSLTLPATITLGSELAITKTLTITGPSASSLTISGNDAVRVLTVTNGITLTLLNVTIAQGSTDTGAGIFNSGTVIISNSVLTANSATGLVGGGGIFNSGTLNIINSTFSNNQSNYSGAGIYNDYNTVTTIENSTFVSNIAENGSGGCVLSTNRLTVTNSTFTGNTAGDMGGCLYVYQGTADVTNATFAQNGAINGGTFYNLDTLILRNSITSSSTSGGNCGGGIPSNGGNNIDDGTTCGWGSSNGSMSSINPLLGLLANNGGATLTMALLTNSPAINGVTYNAPNACPSTDQRGMRRDLRCDIGAYELKYLFMPIIMR